ncbi:Uncharacterised protein [BD1-7 clade bacterium]|uniref:Cxxc_20_cxxc protein n=1 Tax=BD1-7 clade bacterium TaxID=2029982 RepID=A0A5S9P1L6_9GAMM|nr:Uncharacterised protein [BD1-7 clade bacterium]CAA0116315.1 Uncharacterised protein [BD1-7 clade bacterium]CAA0119983.1 Uncharacterised protein [BD1-7 clade bacterium]
MECPYCFDEFTFHDVSEERREVAHFSTRFYCPHCDRPVRTSNRYEVLTLVSFVLIIGSLSLWVLSFFHTVPLALEYVVTVTILGMLLFAVNAVTATLVRDQGPNHG